MSEERLVCSGCEASFVRPHRTGRKPTVCPACSPSGEPVLRELYPVGLADRRSALGMKVAVLARALKVDRSTLTYWEQGAHEAPVDVIERAESVIAAAELALLARLLVLHPEAVS